MNDEHDEFEEIATAIIFWKSALAHQYTQDTREFARVQIARLEARADELANLNLEDEEC